jgi:hypothetical protein
VHKPVLLVPAIKTGSQRSKYTREDVVDRIRAQDPILAQRLDKFLDMAEEKHNIFVGTGTGTEALSIILRPEPSDSAPNFGTFRSDLTFRNYGIVKNPQNSKDLKPYPPGEVYLRTLASLLPDASVYESKNPFDWTIKKTAGSYVPIAEILDKQEEVLNLIYDTRNKIFAAL